MFTSIEKLNQVLLATQLGPISHYCGIKENLTCTCGRPDNWINPHNKREHNPGKHPPENSRRWVERFATTDPAEIATYLENDPDCNFALVMGVKAVALDLDIRPHKNGIDYLRERGDLPRTVTVDSGSGGTHLYFKIPTNSQNLQGIGSAGIDFKDNGVTMAPGSLHKSGKNYSWASGLSPSEVELAEMPEWIITLLHKPPPKPIEAHGDVLDLSVTSSVAVPGERHSDAVVVKNWLKRIKVSGDRSGRDLRNASSLAFWTAHDWDQYLRIWFAYPVRSGKHSGKYEIKQLRRAFDYQLKNWVPKNHRPNVVPKPKRPQVPYVQKAIRTIASGNPNPTLAAHMQSVNPMDQNFSANTKAVLLLRKLKPDMTQSQIGRELEISRQLVYMIIKRHPIL